MAEKYFDTLNYVKTPWAEYVSPMPSESERPEDYEERRTEMSPLIVQSRTIDRLGANKDDKGKPAEKLRVNVNVSKTKLTKDLEDSSKDLAYFKERYNVIDGEWSQELLDAWKNEIQNKSLGIKAVEGTIAKVIETNYMDGDVTFELNPEPEQTYKWTFEKVTV